MSINRNLSASVLLSLLWHFFCISTISIELVPGRKVLAKLTPLEMSDSSGKTKFLTGFADISFLGPILGEEVLISPRTLDKLQPIGKSDNKSLWLEDIVSSGDIGHKTKLLAKNFFRELNSGLNKGKIDIELSKIILESKAILGLSSSSDTSFIKSFESSLTLIEGPLRSRGIIYKPPLPKLKRWAERSNQYNDVQLKFLVSPEGKVIYVEKILSSGDPEVDLLWMRYIKRWQFIPQQSNINQWGKIRLNFDLVE